MKILLGFILLMQVTLHAQVPLPYYSGFDNNIELTGWRKYITATTYQYSWSEGIPKFGVVAPSGTNSINHDYYPGYPAGVADNWMVSPPFFIPNGGTLDSIRYMFSGQSVPSTGDTIALYLLTGNSDPALATSQTLLFDFRGVDYIIDDTFRLKSNLPLTGSTDSSYIAIRYRSSNGGGLWLTTHFDNIGISGNSLTTTTLNYKPQIDDVSIYPNPTSGIVLLESKQKIYDLKVYTTTGQQIYRIENPSSNFSIDLSAYKTGVYFFRYEIDSGSFYKKIMLD
jgi:hypothetical protein